VNSCLYEGHVRHRRHEGPRGEFRHPLYMSYLDLDELPGLFDGHPLFSARRPAPVWFRRADYLGDSEIALTEAVQLLLAERLPGEAPAEGPVRLLTNLRHFGVSFNPVSFYYCFEPSGRDVRAVVADVTNTPWGERHAYVMRVNRPAEHGRASVISEQLEKRLHVSPFMGMERVYDWRLTVPSERLLVHIESRRPGGQSAFDATLTLRRRELDAGSLRRVLLRYPVITATVLARIYGHALGLKLRGARYFAHPRPA
jgi:uncharacterized protein